jgi:hypothetical protein
LTANFVFKNLNNELKTTSNSKLAVFFKRIESSGTLSTTHKVAKTGGHPSAIICI